MKGTLLQFLRLPQLEVVECELQSFQGKGGTRCLYLPIGPTDYLHPHSSLDSYELILGTVAFNALEKMWSELIVEDIPKETCLCDEDVAFSCIWHWILVRALGHL